MFFCTEYTFFYAVRPWGEFFDSGEEALMFKRVAVFFRYIRVCACALLDLLTKYLPVYSI
jgi:hypothetical protein